MNAPWLVAEAYKYRRLRECFAVSKFWREYDVFFRQKVSKGTIAAPPDRGLVNLIGISLFCTQSAIPSRVLKMLCSNYQCGSPSRSRSLLVPLRRPNSRGNVLCSKS